MGEDHQSTPTSILQLLGLQFTAASGEPVLCVVIVERCYSKSLGSGLDIFKVTADMGELNDQQFMESVSNNDRGAASGGPKCTFCGKTLNCLVFCSKHGSITGSILADCLKYLDQNNDFARTGLLKLFLLLDGHNSRYDLNFLEYIWNKDYRRSAGIGLPYAAHIWQVGDSRHQNGNYKRELSIAKEQLMLEETKRNLPMVFKPSDVNPIVKKAWSQSFANVATNCKAIVERGWCPCNQKLLTKEIFIRTKRLVAVNSAKVWLMLRIQYNNQPWQD
jgi:hypothetical protein